MIEFVQLDDENFKGFGSENSLDFIYPLGKINIFIGGNNSGKSRFIRAIHSNLDFLKDKNISIAQYFNDATYIANFSYLVKHFSYNEFYLDFDIGTNKNISALIHFNDKFKDLTSQSFSKMPFKVQEAFDRTKRFISGLGIKSKVTNNNKKNILSYYIPVSRGLKPLFKQGDGFSYDNIYKDRVVYDYGDKIKVYSGLEIFEDIKSKLLGTEEERNIIKQFENFLAEKIFGESVTLIPKYKEDVLNIKIGEEEQRSIVNIGDGVQAMLLILYPVFINKYDLCYFFIEEPETHLHPNYQKLLIELLHEIGEKHQFFITTHSNNFLNSNISNLFEVKKGQKAIVKHVDTDTGKLDVLANLGYKASDLLQTNFIIWVEGITDKMYVNYLISKNSNLIENVHYTIMLFNGDGAKHIVNEIEDFEILTSINRNCAWICDSDKLSEDAISEKASVQVYLESKGVYFWMTPYREIENHIDEEVFLKIARKISNKKSLQYYSQDFKYGDRFELFDNDAQSINSYTINVTPELEKLLKDVNFNFNKIPKAELVQKLKNGFHMKSSIDMYRIKKKPQFTKEIITHGFEPDFHLKSMISELIARIIKANQIKT